MSDAQDERFDGDDSGTDRGWHGLAGQSHNRRVELPGGHSLQEGLVVLLGERDLDRGVRAMELSERDGKAMVSVR